MELRDNFWIPSGRQQIRKILSRCVLCQKLQFRPFNEERAALPLDRVREANSFEIFGVDFAGPFLHRAKKATINDSETDNEVAYMCLFTCATTRANHLELVKDITASTFILALKRFFGRRGMSTVMYSDNAKTFRKVDRYLRVLKTDLTISEYLAHNRIQWKYSASLASWWGGFWKWMVRTVKELFLKSIGTQVIDRDKLETALIDIECVINARPLTYLSDEVGEQQPLTPAQLLLGHRTSRRPAEPTRPVAATRASRDELLSMDRARQAQVLEWWRRWIKDYLHELSNFQSKGSTSSRKIQLGDLVVIHKDNIKIIRWKTGVVIELNRGRDGVVRLSLIHI